MMRKRIDHGPDLFAWADAQAARLSAPPTKPATRKQAKPVAHQPAEPAAAAPPSQQPARIVDFIERRETLPRFIICHPAPFAGLDREIARKEGRLPPAPILKLPVRHPA